jgi:hypothetical protein
MRDHRSVPLGLTILPSLLAQAGHRARPADRTEVAGSWNGWMDGVGAAD